MVKQVLSHVYKNLRGITMEVLYEVRGRNLLIYLPEELDHHNAKIITEQSDWYIISNKIQNIIFNFKRTKFMDSSGIGVIMGRYKLVKNPDRVNLQMCIRDRLKLHCLLQMLLVPKLYISTTSFYIQLSILSVMPLN